MSAAIALPNPSQSGIFDPGGMSALRDNPAPTNGMHRDDTRSSRSGLGSSFRYFAILARFIDSAETGFYIVIPARHMHGITVGWHHSSGNAAGAPASVTRLSA